jgi:hypothetical protein
MTTSREPPCLLSFSTFEEKDQEMTTSWEVCCHFLHLRKKPKKWQRARKLVVICYNWGKKQKDDDKPFGSSSFATDEKRNKEMMMSQKACCHLLHLSKEPRDICRIPCSFLAFFNSRRKPNKCRLLWLYCGVHVIA